MAKRLNETERKRLLNLQLFYLNVKKEIDALEIRLGIKRDQQEPLGIYLEIKTDAKHRKIANERKAA